MKPILISCTLAALMALNAGPVWANDFDKAIAQAREGVEKSSFAQALEAARRARALNPGDFRSYYYEAMAQLGVGNKAEARAAVKAAQERAPASAKDALQKLALMAAEQPFASPEVTQQPKAVIVSCTYSGNKKSFHSSGQEEVAAIPEETKIFRLEDKSFQYWNSQFNTWSGITACSRISESVTTSDRRRDGRTITNTEWPGECRAAPDRFYAKTINDYGQDRPDVIADITKIIRSLSINRLTGVYLAEEYTYWSDSRLPWKEEYSGVCRPAKDPSAANPKF